MPASTVDQWEYGAYVSGRDVASLPVIAAALEVSEATARRQLDGLVCQGLLESIPGRRGVAATPRLYVVPGRTPTGDDWREVERGER